MRRVIYIMSIALSSVFSACTDWLTITPETTVVAENLLTTNEGVQEALNGTYILLRNVYGPESTMGGTGLAETLAATWKTSEGSSEYMLATHKYNIEDNGIGGALNSTFQGLYNIVANLNPLIEGITENRSKLDVEVYNIVKGEALAIRACVHLDLIRLWGPMPSKVNDAKEYLPYVIHNTTAKYTYLTYGKYMEMLFVDLDEAERLLKESDPILEYPANNTIQSYSKWTKRQSHFNYYGVLGLKARALLWNGDTEEALRYARMIKDAKNTDGTPKFRLANDSDFENLADGMWDATFYPEHLCGVSVENYDYQKGAYAATSQSAFMDYGVYPVPDNWMVFTMTVFDNNTNDLRVKQQWYWNYSNKTGLYPPNYKMVFPRKYNGISPTSKSGIQNMPVMRLAEVYLMIAEHAPLSEANEVYEEFCEARNINRVELTDANRDEKILKEWIRELMAEGQNFFTYKRKAVERMLIMFPEEASNCGETEYVLPLPPKEYMNEY